MRVGLRVGLRRVARPTECISADARDARDDDDRERRRVRVRVATGNGDGRDVERDAPDERGGRSWEGDDDDAGGGGDARGSGEDVGGEETTRARWRRARDDARDVGTV